MGKSATYHYQQHQQKHNAHDVISSPSDSDVCVCVCCVTYLYTTLLYTLFGSAVCVLLLWGANGFARKTKRYNLPCAECVCGGMRTGLSSAHAKNHKKKWVLRMMKNPHITAGVAETHTRRNCMHDWWTGVD